MQNMTANVYQRLTKLTITIEDFGSYEVKCKMSYFRQHDLESQLSRGELHERFAGNIEKCFP